MTADLRHFLVREFVRRGHLHEMLKLSVRDDAMSRVFFRIVFGCLLVWSASNITTAQSLTEARFVLRDIQSWLPGIYDTEPQIFLETAFGAGEDGPHSRNFLRIQPTESAEADIVAFLTEWHGGGKTAPILRREIWSFRVDEETRGVRMLRYPMLASVGTELKTDKGPVNNSAESTPYPCVLTWFQGQGDVYASSLGDQCQNGGYSVTLGEEGLWILNHGELAAPLVGIRKDQIHTKFFRASEMECFVNIVHQGQPTSVGLDGRTLLNPVFLHDRGDEFVFETTESSPRKFVLKLRKSMWPSRSGRNFVPMLMLWLYRDQVSAETVEGSAWAAADSKRVAFDARGVGARCKVPTLTP